MGSNTKVALPNWKWAVEFYNRRLFIDFLSIRLLLTQFLFTPLAMNAACQTNRSISDFINETEMGSEKDEISIVIHHLNSSYTPLGPWVHEKFLFTNTKDNNKVTYWPVYENTWEGSLFLIIKPTKKLKLNSVALVASELYRQSGRRRSAKLVPTFADRGCHVVSATDPHDRLISVF